MLSNTKEDITKEYGEVLGRMSRWCRMMDLAQNRVDMLNLGFGFGVSGALDNPFRLVTSRGLSEVRAFGDPLARFPNWSLPDAEVALARLDACADLVWSASKAGALRGVEWPSCVDFV